MKRFAPEHLLSLHSEVASVYSDGRDRRLHLPSLNHFRHPVGTEHLGVAKGLIQLYSEPRRQLSKNTVIFSALLSLLGQLYRSSRGATGRVPCDRCCCTV